MRCLVDVVVLWSGIFQENVLLLTADNILIQNLVIDEAIIPTEEMKFSPTIDRTQIAKGMGDIDIVLESMQDSIQDLDGNVIKAEDYAYPIFSLSL